MLERPRSGRLGGCGRKWGRLESRRGEGGTTRGGAGFVVVARTSNGEKSDLRHCVCKAERVGAGGYWETRGGRQDSGGERFGAALRGGGRPCVERTPYACAWPFCLAVVGARVLRGQRTQGWRRCRRWTAWWRQTRLRAVVCVGGGVGGVRGRGANERRGVGGCGLGGRQGGQGSRSLTRELNLRDVVRWGAGQVAVDAHETEVDVGGISADIVAGLGCGARGPAQDHIPLGDLLQHSGGGGERAQVGACSRAHALSHRAAAGATQRTAAQALADEYPTRRTPVRRY